MSNTPFASIAAASSLDFGAASSDAILLTGDNGGADVTTLGVTADGVERWVSVQDGGFAMKHSTQIVCAGNGNRSILTTPGASFRAKSLGGGVWVLDNYAPGGIVSYKDARNSGGDWTHNIYMGARQATTFCAFGLLGGANETKLTVNSIYAASMNDTCDFVLSSAGGSYEAPTSLSIGPHAHIHSVPFDTSGNRFIPPASRPYNDNVYMGANVKETHWITETQTVSARGGAYSVEVAGKGTVAPISRFWVSSKGRFVRTGDLYEKVGPAYPFNPTLYSELAQFSPVGDINPVEYEGYAVDDIPCSSIHNGGTYAVSYSKWDDHANSRFMQGWNFEDDEWCFTRVVNGELRKSATWGRNSGSWKFGYDGAGGVASMQVNIRTGADAGMKIQGAIVAQGQRPTLSVDGSAANIDIGFAPKGTGRVVLKGAVLVGNGVVSGNPGLLDKGLGTINQIGGYYVNNVQVLGGQGAAIADATSTTVVATVNAMLARMRAHGIIAT